MSTVLNPQTFTLPDYGNSDFILIFDDFGQPLTTQSGSSGTISGNTPLGAKTLTGIFAIPQYFNITATTGTANIATTDLTPYSTAELLVIGRGYGSAYYSGLMTSSPVSYSAYGNIAAFSPTIPTPQTTQAGGYTGIQAKFYNNHQGRYSNTVSLSLPGISLTVEDGRPILSGGSYSPVSQKEGVTYSNMNGVTPNSDGSVSLSGASDAQYQINIPASIMDSAAVGGNRFRVQLSPMVGYLLFTISDIDGNQTSLNWRMTTVSSSLGDMNLLEFDTAGLNYVGGALTINVQISSSGSQPPPIGKVQTFIYTGAMAKPRFWTDDTLAYESL